MIERLQLTVDAWLSYQGKEVAFGSRDENGRLWTPILPLSSWSGFKCKRCGIQIVNGWRLGAVDGRGKTAYCKGCVDLHDEHVGANKEKCDGTDSSTTVAG